MRDPINQSKWQTWYPDLQINIAIGEISWAITPVFIIFFDYFLSFDYFHLFDYSNFFYYSNLFDYSNFFDFSNFFDYSNFFTSSKEHFREAVKNDSESQIPPNL